MTNANGSDLHADLSGDLEYKRYIEDLLASDASMLGAAVLNLGTGESLVAGEFTEEELLYPRIAFSAQPSDGNCGSTVFSGEVNEWVMRIDSDFIVTCGSPGNRNFFLVMENAENGLRSALTAMETLIGQGAETLREKGGRGAILENRTLREVGDIANSRCGTNGNADYADAAMLDLFGVGDGRSAGRNMQALVDAGATLHQVQAAGLQGSWGYNRLRFAPDHIVAIHVDGQCPPLQMDKLLKRLSNDVLRRVIHQILNDDAFSADTALPETDADFNKVIEELRKLPADDLRGRLIVGGFANHSLGEAGEMDDGAMVLRCRECIYYLPHQRWCDLPELPLPVEPDWYCKLWKL